MRALYDDWKMRRERLDKCASSAHYTEQARVFDYLLARYADDPLAWEQARFPLQADLAIDSRAILVHHHMALREFGGTRTVAEAHTRARNILTHISKVNPQASIRAPSLHAALREEDPAERDRLRNERSAPSSAQQGDSSRGFWNRFWRICSAEVYLGDPKTAQAALALLPRALAVNNPVWIEKLCKWSLSAWPDTYHPAMDEETVDRLFVHAQFSDFERNAARCSAALEVLERCRNVGVLHAYARGWIEHIGSEPFLARLHEFLHRHRQRCADFLRMQLAGGNPLTRARAAMLLGTLGDLHDIGMFQDLLALPDVQMELDERDAYLQAMRVLSGMK